MFTTVRKKLSFDVDLREEVADRYVVIGFRKGKAGEIVLNSLGELEVLSKDSDEYRLVLSPKLGEIPEFRGPSRGKVFAWLGSRVSGHVFLSVNKPVFSGGGYQPPDERSIPADDPALDWVAPKEFRKLPPELAVARLRYTCRYRRDGHQFIPECSSVSRVHLPKLGSFCPICSFQIEISSHR